MGMRRWLRITGLLRLFPGYNPVQFRTSPPSNTKERGGKGINFADVVMQFMEDAGCASLEEFAEQLERLWGIFQDPYSAPVDLSVVPGDTGRTCHDTYISFNTANPKHSTRRIRGVRWYTCATGC